VVLIETTIRFDGHLVTTWSATETVPMPPRGFLMTAFAHPWPSKVKVKISLTARALIQAYVSCRLDYCNSVFYGVWRLRAEASVDAERCRTAHHWRQSKMWSHHARATSVAMASCPATSRLQYRMLGAPCHCLDWHQPCRQQRAASFTQHQLTAHASFHVHTTSLVTRVPMLPVHRCGTIHHLSFDRTVSYGQFRRQLQTFNFLRYTIITMTVCLLAT